MNVKTTDEGITDTYTYWDRSYSIWERGFTTGTTGVVCWNTGWVYYPCKFYPIINK